jgi:single-strand DNA-binding protein
MDIGPWHGYVGKDATDIRYTPQGKAVSDFSLAMDNGKDANGEKRPATWVKIVMWGKQAESLAQYITKGKYVIVAGRPAVEAYIDKKSGEARANLVVNMSQLAFGGGAKAEGEQATKPKQQEKSQESDYSITDDDIPF